MSRDVAHLLPTFVIITLRTNTVLVAQNFSYSFPSYFSLPPGCAAVLNGRTLNSCSSITDHTMTADDWNGLEV